MNKRLLHLLLATAVIPLLLTGCTNAKEEVYPTQVASTTSPTIEPDDEIVTQTPAPSTSPKAPKSAALLNTDAFIAQPLKGMAPSDMSQILLTAQEFAIQGFHPEFLNGNWTQKSIEEIALVFSPYVTSPVKTALETIDITDPESATSLSSLAALFTPTKKITATEECLNAVDFSGCLYTDLVLSKPTIKMVDKQVEVTFSASTQRDLLLEQMPATSDVTINHTLYFVQDDEHGWLVNGINNTFEYGKVVTQE